MRCRTWRLKLMQVLPIGQEQVKKPPEEQRLGRPVPSRQRSRLSVPQGSNVCTGEWQWVGGVSYDVTLGPSHSSPSDPLQPLDYSDYQFTLEHLALSFEGFNFLS